MKIYLHGVLLSVSEPWTPNNTELKVQRCVIQHEFNQEPRYNKYACFEVLGEERIKQMALKPQEEVELAIDLNAKVGNADRWFNSLNAYAVERDKTKFHYYQDNRPKVAVMPSGGGAAKPAGNTPGTDAGQNVGEDDMFAGNPYEEMP